MAVDFFLYLVLKFSAVVDYDQSLISPHERAVVTKSDNLCKVIGMKSLS